MADLLQALRDHSRITNVTGGYPLDKETLTSRAADEIERLRLLCKMLADQDANGVAWMLSEHSHLQEIFES